MGGLLKIVRRKFLKYFSLPKSSEKPPYARLFWVVFIYAAAAAVFVQFIGLPYILSAWHAGSGLLAGMDSVAYHAQAVELAERIRTEGWSVWEITPRGHFSVGISAAIYALTVSKPWVVIPFNAAAHAFSALVLLRIFMLVTRNWRWGAVAALPFVFFPSAIIWYTQLLKDGYFFLGVLLFAYGWMILAKASTWNGEWREPAKSMLLIVIGFTILALIRFFMLSLMFWVALLLFLVLAAFLAINAQQRVLPYRNALTGMLVAGACVSVLLVLKSHVIVSPAIDIGFGQLEPSEHKVKILRGNDSKDSNDSKDQPLTFLESKLLTIGNIRYGYASSRIKQGSMIDTDVQLGHPADFVRYLPRAAQIVFLAPFPYHWFDKGTYASTTFMRRVSMFEMLVVYAALAFLPFLLWRYRARGEIWVLLTLCTSVMVVYAFAIPNVGTLHRIRYGYLMLLVGFGILGGLMAWEGVRRRRRIMPAPS